MLTRFLLATCALFAILPPAAAIGQQQSTSELLELGTGQHRHAFNLTSGAKTLLIVACASGGGGAAGLAWHRGGAGGDGGLASSLHSWRLTVEGMINIEAFVGNGGKGGQPAGDGSNLAGGDGETTMLYIYERDELLAKFVLDGAKGGVSRTSAATSQAAALFGPHEIYGSIALHGTDHSGGPGAPPPDVESLSGPSDPARYSSTNARPPYIRSDNRSAADRCGGGQGGDGAASATDSAKEGQDGGPAFVRIRLESLSGT